jgi:hypothetical protein
MKKDQVVVSKNNVLNAFKCLNHYVKYFNFNEHLLDFSKFILKGYTEVRKIVIANV